MSTINREDWRMQVRKRAPEWLMDRWYDQRLKAFGKPLSVARPYSLVSTLNLMFLQNLAERVHRDGTPGDILEAGVYQGGSAGVLGYAIRRDPSRKLRLFDSFAGMPEATDRDDEFAKQFVGTHVGSEERTRRILERLEVPASQVEIHVGLFEDTYPKAEHRPVALLHVDCDFHAPAALTLETWWEDVSPGGFVVFNDYGAFRGCREAVDEFLASRPGSPKPVMIDHDAAFLQKP